MKHAEDLNRFYETRILPELARLEAQRKKIKRKLIPYLVIAAALFIASLWLILHFGLVLDWMLLALLLDGVLIGAWYFGHYRGFRDRFKEQVGRKIVQFIDPELIYQKDGFVPKPAFIKSGIFPGRPDRYEGEDLVLGRIGKADIQVSSIDVKQLDKRTEYHPGAGSRRKRTRVEVQHVFKGLFFMADFPRQFKAATVVLPDRAEKLFGRLGRKLQAMNVLRDDLIKISDPEFEKHFVVYGDDPAEARYILTTDLMRKLLALRSKANADVHVSFVESQLFMAVPQERSLLEPGVVGSIVEYEKIQRYVENLQIMISIVEELNIKLRIW